jgi:hypothetical protein
MPDPEIYASLQNDFVLIAQYVDDQNDPKPRKVFDRYNPEGGSVPVYMVLDTDGREIARLSWPAHKPNMTKSEFLEFMKEGLARIRSAGD